MVQGNLLDLKWSVALDGVREHGDTSGNLYSDWVPLRRRHVSFHLIWTGTTAGTLTIALSNDKSTTAHTLAITDFTPNLTNPAGSSGSTAGQMTTDFLWAKFIFTRSSGSGKLYGTTVDKRD